MPEQAAREQVKYIIPVIDESIKNSKLKIKNLEAIAVTIGPGLIGSLLIGIETAKTLSMVFQKPIIPVNHLVGHIYANFIKGVAGPAFPALCLLVSGGHTELVLMKNHGDYQVVGQTLDDAAGECFDKCARLLGLGYPGGPAVEAAASKLKIKNEKLKMIINNLKLNLPRPMITDSSFNFSFSGLKTAVLYLLKKLTYRQLTISKQQLISFELQEAITDVLVAKTLKAAEKFQVKSIIVGGGVASNQRLRDKFQLTIRQLADQQLTINIFFPDKKLCTDNAIGIASSAFFNFKPILWSQIKPNPSLSI